MGKRYYCEVCDKTMVSSPSIIKTHNRGIVHQKLAQEHYQQFKDAATLLSEESVKKPCNRFMNGNCQFGSICRFSHFTPEQIYALKQQVDASKTKTLHQPEFENLQEKLQEYKKQSKDSTSILFFTNGESQILPWTYNTVYDGFDVPLSLKRFDVETFKDADLAEWG